MLVFFYSTPHHHHHRPPSATQPVAAAASNPPECVPSSYVAVKMRLQSLPLLLLLAVVTLPPATPTSAARPLTHPRARNHYPSEDLAEEPLMPASLLLEELQQTNGQLVNLTRQHDGDTFHTSGELTTWKQVVYQRTTGSNSLIHSLNVFTLA